jgi:nucleoside-diphosphate-sugar epimerase
MGGERYLVTGAMGCIGAWVLRHLVDEGAWFIAADLGTDPVRPRLLLSEDEIVAVRWRKLDVTDTAAVAALVADEGITHIVHLAGMQIPFCRADPPLGAAVNVLGTVNIFEAARHNGVRGLSYASSLAALGPATLYPDRPVADDVQPAPATLYGVYKVANEETARIYWQDWQVGSVGLRPYVVYGVGRDQGMTADNAKAILATAAGKPYKIRYGGEVALQHASDVARIFIDCARSGHQGAAVHNLRGDVITVETFAERLRGVAPDAQVTWDAGNVLPFPADLADAGLRGLLGQVPHQSLEAAIERDLGQYRALIAQGRIDLTQLDR